MRKRVLLFVLASVLMSVCIPVIAQQPQYKLPQGLTKEEVMKKIPGLVIDDEGNVTQDGKPVEIISLDYYSGKPQQEKEEYLDLNGKLWFPEHEYVDLGLSVKWATCNVGADKPEDVGGLFAWGETETKTEYNYSTYKFCVDGNRGNYSKYNDTDQKTRFDLEDDVAHVKWGGSWRVPTSAEMDELRRECNWTWTTENDVKGFRVSGKKEGYENNSIFIPVNAFNDSVAVTTLHQYPEYGVYWSSTLSHESGSFLMGGWDYANGIWFCRDASMGNTSYRNEGRSIRPVHP